MPHGLYPSRDGEALYVSDRGAGKVSVVDPSQRNRIVDTWTIPGGGSPDMGGVSADGRMLWLSGRNDGVVYGFDTEQRPAGGEDPGRRQPARDLRLAAAGALLARAHREHAMRRYVAAGDAPGALTRGVWWRLRAGGRVAGRASVTRSVPSRTRSPHHARLPSPFVAHTASAHVASLAPAGTRVGRQARRPGGRRPRAARRRSAGRRPVHRPGAARSTSAQRPQRRRRHRWRYPYTTWPAGARRRRAASSSAAVTPPSRTWSRRLYGRRLARRRTPPDDALRPQRRARRSHAAGDRRVRRRQNVPTAVTRPERARVRTRTRAGWCPASGTPPPRSAGTRRTCSGERCSGTSWTRVQAVDLRTGRTRVVARLPVPLGHAMAATVGGRILLMGGRVTPGPTDIAAMWWFDPRHRTVQPGRVPCRTAAQRRRGRDVAGRRGLVTRWRGPVGDRRTWCLSTLR